MNHYVYRWSFEPRPGMHAEFEVAATNMIVARRIISGFIEAHEGADWIFESVQRKPSGRAAEQDLAVVETSSFRRGNTRSFTKLRYKL